ncbi:putative histone acetyltransferase [Aspergillus clavatus NRRL 1]|uniref:Histone acetyltransferase n=1 Tax=Aspergillus clavatus (strain ATCC 1007 / CBS 513.65 / DSM 816 / NCTC 3887 / NRRL 1 / QM 1276 / 107) TaxID=344612 RepID=A1CI27_ASPCL|nr:histone acetyltransferase, putative [Aspergillus clavatus NRRL 1]EAW10532.1 histone acetyltransferase, putative [Aspergillus clavatus NRRL 1]
MPATVLPAVEEPEARPPADLVDSDQDAEGEEETDLYEMDQQLQNAVHQAYSGEVADEDQDADYDEDLDAEGEPDTELTINGDNQNQGAESVGPVNVPDERRSVENNEDVVSATADGEGDPVFDNQSDSDASASSSSSSESDAGEEEWEAESNGREDAEGDQPVRGNCIFCHQDEDHDPSEEFEEYLTCAVCGDHSHRQCAREQNALDDTQDATSWRCPTCVREKLQPTTEQIDANRRIPRQKKMRRELLPAHTGEEGSGFHSIFNTTDVNDQLLTGSRSLRKRKASSTEAGEHTPVLRKWRRQSSLRSARAESGDHAFGGVDTLSPVRTRSRRTRGEEKDNCRIVLKQFGRLVISFRLNDTKMSKILNSRSRSQIRGRRTPKPTPVAQEPLSHFAPIPPAPYISPFYSFNDRETDESKSKPYGGILSETDADTSRTLPTHVDRERFEVARQKAEEEWQRRVMEAESGGESVQHASQKVSGPPSRIKYINFGGYEIETWYAAPYPEEYSRNRVLYICEFCLKYMNSDYVAWRHKLKCPAKHPPGDEIYRDGSISIFEVDGRKNPVYCQNLCLLAKLFLGSKTLYYDVEPFLFYVMTEFDDLGCHFVGYFSKEKRPSSANNVSCILTLPIHQRKGYGNLLIDFSYLLTRIEGKTGSPEKPLSDMGLVSYRNYWRLILSYQLRNQKTPISVAELSERTGMTFDDVVSGLEGLRALVRDPVTKTYALRLNYSYFEECIRNWEDKGYVQLNPSALVWTPYIMGRSNQSQFDRAPLHAVAPREDPEEEEEEEEEEGEGAKQMVSEEEQQITGRLNGILHRPVNGIRHTESDNRLNKPAGPPSTHGFSNTNGFHHRTTATASSSADAPSNPVAGIPPSRFEIYPPVQAPIFKRKPGRPFGSKSMYNKVAITPTTARTSGRGTPRRASTLAAETPTANPGSTRRGRGAKPIDSSAPEPTNGETNGFVNGDHQTSEDAPGEVQDTSQQVSADPETEILNHIGNGIEPGPANGTEISDSMPKIVDGDLPHSEPRITSKGRGVENRGKLSRSTSRKSVVEKSEVTIPAEEIDTAQENKPAARDADGDAIMET